MERLLCIVGKMDFGGAETFVMKIYRSIDRTKYQIDFAVASQEEGFYDSEIISLGGHIHHILPKSKGLLKNFFSIKRLVKKEKYISVMRISQNSLSALELLAARMGGAKKLIFRSSNTRTMTNGIEPLIHRLCMFMPRHFANIRIAPSTEAGQFMFGKRYINKKRVIILKNGIDLNFYKYNNDKRILMRKTLQVDDDCFVIGHIGRFNQQKNHAFLLDFFIKFITKKPNSTLILIGDGELKEEIVQKIENSDISNKVLLLGKRHDIPDLLCAMDCLAFPSLYEGMPNVVIEAQCSGLDCYLSNTITKEADLTGDITYLPINQGVDCWANAIILNANKNRLQAFKKLKDNGYDITDVTRQFVEIAFCSK